ncbi:TIGR02996 domain-containing protein [Myxococcus sp. K38C18041901]|uniref:TIGR02996 domain-containing protein n=1 Tax=Myxococcus guangdongensis TaxID=2906760 RepID=UPI0020A77DD9|nr:TIGR02996 domain-containing protein [Myxococcus guangdongensis]MCP3059529.1 TIGR02996 domain-containing protein [Myxococcus guangdongensis]
MPSAPKKKSPTLEEATNQGDWASVLAHLLTRWRAAPHSVLAERIIGLGKKLAADTPVPKDWDALAEKRDAATLTTLLAALLDKGSVKARPRLETLAKWPEDPRIDRWVASQFAEPPFTSTGARPFWTRLAPLARRIRDARAASTVLKARKGYDLKDDAEAFFAGHVDRIRAQLDAASREGALSAADHRAIIHVDAEMREAEPVALRKARDAGERTNADGGTLLPVDAEMPDADPVARRKVGDAEALLARVLAEPGDDEARAVLADVLLEQGHPRGELIALQLEATRRALTAAERKRERELLKSARKELLGPLDEVLKPDCVFTRGFLSHAALKQGNASGLQRAIQKTSGHPLWATVEHLEGRGDYDITTDPVMKSLRSLVNSDVRTQDLAKRPGLESLAMRGALDQWVELAQDPSAFPALRHLDIFAFHWWAARFLDSPLVSRLERLQLRVYVSGPSAAEALALIPLVPRLKVPDLTFRLVRNDSKDWSCGFRFVRGPDGRHEVHLFTTAMNEPYEQLVRDDLLAGLERIDRLEPFKRSKLILDHRLRTDARHEVLQRVGELDGVLAE